LGKIKLRCGTCTFLEKKALKEGHICRDLGKNKGYPACRSWEPDIDSLSDTAKNIIFQLGTCNDRDFPILRWILDKQQMLADNDVRYRIGDTVFFQSHEKTYSIVIINATQKTITGRDPKTGVTFTLTHSSDIYTTKQLLETTLKDKAAEEEAEAEVRRNQPRTDPKLGFSGENVNLGVIIGNIEDQKTAEEDEKRQRGYQRKFKPDTEVTMEDGTPGTIKELRMDTEMAVIITLDGEKSIPLETLTLKIIAC